MLSITINSTLDHTKVHSHSNLTFERTKIQTHPSTFFPKKKNKQFKKIFHIEFLSFEKNRLPNIYRKETQESVSSHNKSVSLPVEQAYRIYAMNKVHKGALLSIRQKRWRRKTRVKLRVRPTSSDRDIIYHHHYKLTVVV